MLSAINLDAISDESHVTLSVLLLPHSCTFAVCSSGTIFTKLFFSVT
jgi:hypothetical protein